MASEAPAPLKIVYLNADTLVEQYDYFRNQKEALDKRQAEASQRMNQKGAALEKEFRQVQEKIQQGLLAPSQIAEEEQRLGQKQQSLMAEQEKLSKELKNMSYVCDKYRSEQFAVYGTFTNDV